MNDEYEQRLRDLVGRQLHPRRHGPDPVNAPMIRHWAEAMGTDNPVYQDETAAEATGREGIVAPASMLQSWTMPGYSGKRPASDEASVAAELDSLLVEGGYSSIVATDSDLEFHRELRPGDEISMTEVIESISPEKTTGLGTGRFVTTRRTYRDQADEVVASQGWRTLRFRPREPEQPRPTRPRPAINRDNAFWFEAAEQHRLVIQRCTDCTTLRHPPGPCCAECGSFDWDTVESSGRGAVYSYVINHHPRHPAFEYPHVVAVVELAEGTRLITNLVGIEPDAVEIGLPVVLDWLDADSELSLPVFRPA